MTIGFTGTRAGMTNPQEIKLHQILASEPRVEFHHGDCQGADERAHWIAFKLEFQIVVHPPINNSWRANDGRGCGRADEVLEPKPYLERNRDIVYAADILIAAPGSDHEEKRGGTWYTIRYARKKKMHVIIIYPDGRVEASDE